MQQVLQLHPSERQVLATGDGCSCVAIAYQYPRAQPGPWRQLLASPWALLLLLLAVRWARLPLLQDAAELADQQRRRFYSRHGPFTYLSVVATRPGLQRRGLGRSMLRHVLGEADARGQWAYLEASSEASRALYLRLGFSEVRRVQPAPGAPPTWVMCRPPARGRGDGGVGGSGQGQGEGEVCV
jgi:GNAT superfamily N-acetyltransferase